MAVAVRLMALPEVVWAEPDYVHAVDLLSEQIEQQWYLGLKDPVSCLDDPAPDSCCAGCDIGVEEAWRYTRGSPTVKIAFCDAGADMQHPDLFDVWARNPDPREDINNNGTVELCSYLLGGDINGIDEDSSEVADDLFLGWFMQPWPQDSLHWRAYWKHGSFVDHGTAVAGILGAITNNGTGVASVAGGNDSLQVQGVRLVQFSFDGSTGGFFSSGFVRQLYDARTYGARIFSLSVRVDSLNNGIPEAVAEVSDSMLIVAGSGNDGGARPISAFARLPGVMAIGGYECKHGGRWIVPPYVNPGNPEGSNFGDELSVLGPADDDWNSGPYERMVMASTVPSTPQWQYVCTPAWPDTVDCFGGTSAATPVVASIAALILSYSDEHNLGLTPAQARKLIELTAEDVQCDPDSTRLPGCGCGDPADSCIVHLLGWDSHTGYGRVDAGRALTLPIADLTLEPYSDVVIWRGRVRFNWEKMDLDPLSGGSPDHLEIHYWVPEVANEWVLVADTLAWNGPSFFEWAAPDSFPIGDNRYFRLSIVDSEGRALNQDYQRFSVLETTATDEPGARAQQVEFMGMGPNPASRLVYIRYALGEPTDIDVGIYDVSGRRIRTVAQERQSTGTKKLEWDCKDESGHRVANGIYFLRMVLGMHRKVERLVVVR